MKSSDKIFRAQHALNVAREDTLRASRKSSFMASVNQHALNWGDWLKRLDIEAIDEVVTYISERGKPESDEARWYRDDAVAELLSERNPEDEAYGAPHLLANEIVRLVRPNDARGLATAIVWSHVQDQIRQYEKYA